MQQLRATLHCARLSAAITFVLFFLTSCTNYWLHAIIYPSANDTAITKLFSNSTGTNQPYVSEKGDATEVTQPVALKSERLMTRNKHTNKHRIHFLLFNSTGTNQEYVSEKGDATDVMQPVALKRGRFTTQNKHVNRMRIHFLTQWRVIYYHEGFFWKCWFTDQWVEDTISKFIFINQPPLKCCVHAYHSPFPSTNEKSYSEFKPWIVYRRLWSALMFLAVIFITIGCVTVTFQAFCETYQLYKLVGGIFLLSAVLYSISVIMYAFWISAVPQMITANQAIMQDNMDVIIDRSEVKFGWSFMTAPVAAFFSLVAGLLFIKIAGVASKERSSII